MKLSDKVQALERDRAKLLGVLKDLMTAIEPELTGPTKNVPKSTWAEQWDMADKLTKLY